MKKNLNIAYLNGAEGMIRRSCASSGGSSSGNGNVDEENDLIYYDISSADETTKQSLACLGDVVKIDGTVFGLTIKTIGNPLLISLIIGAGIEPLKNTKAIAVNFGNIVKGDFGSGTQEFTMNDIITGSFGNLDTYPQITKEQFYLLE